jgi:hypothetical protein
MAGIFGGAAAAQKPIRYTSVDVQTSALGGCIPLLWGRNRVGTNVVWLNNFKSTSAGGKGGGKGGGKDKGSGYSYSTALILALCEGPIQDVLTVWADQTETTLAALGLTLLDGTAAQAAPGWIESNYAAQAMSYAETAYVWASSYALGGSPEIPNHTFEIDGYLSGTTNTGGLTSGLPDANPADIISDYILSAQYGLDPGATYVDAASLASYKTYCQAQALLLSPYLRTQEQATQTLQRWAQLSNSWIFWNGVHLKFVPLGDAAITANGAAYTPNLTPLYALTPADFIAESKGGALVTVTRIDPADGYNRVELDNRNRADQYNTDPTYWEDPTSVSAYGQLQSQTITADEVCDPGVAATMCTLIGQRSVYIRNSYAFTLDYTFVLLEPGDIVTLTEPAIGLSAQPVRITDVEEDDKGLLKFNAEECPGSVGIAVALPVQSNSASAGPNFLADPGNVNPPLIFEPPVSITGGVPQLWIGASGGANWGGAQVWGSVDGTNYVSLGKITTGTLQGALTAALPSHADPDTTDTLAVNLAASQGILSTAVSDADANALRTLAMVDSEVIAYGAVAATGAYTATLSYLRRGVYGSAIAAHASGAPFSQIAPGAMLAVTLPQAYVGVGLYIKLCSFNIFGNAGQALSEATAYTYTPTGVAYSTSGGSVVTVAPAAPTGLAVTAIAGGFTLNWDATTDATIDLYQVWGAAGASQPFSAASLVGTVPAPATSVTITGEPASALSVFLVAVNAAGSSAPAG